MKAKIKYYLLLFALICHVLIFLSCQKELTCEGCKDANQPPIAVAGPNHSITLPRDSILLDGSASKDADGKISSYRWTKISGPASFHISNANIPTTIVKNLVEGNYFFELTVTDNEGMAARDTVNITVIADDVQINRPPVANAGSDTSIMLPANIVELNGTASADPDNNITAYTWSKISGPSTFNINNPNIVQTQAINLTEGVFLFELKVTDAAGLFSKDTVKVGVIKSQPPCTDCEVVFVSDRDGNFELYSCNADGSGIRRLTTNVNDDYNPAWSPDKKQIAFISHRSGNAELYTMNADGSNIIRKTFSEGREFHPTWSPDGNKIAYSYFNNNRSEIWLVSNSSGAPSPLFIENARSFWPAFSPDGTKIALSSDLASLGNVYDIYTIRADGTGLTKLTSADPTKLEMFGEPSWSPDGQKIAMAIGNTCCIINYFRIGIMNADGSGIIEIRRDGEPFTRTSWSTDGSKIAYTSESTLMDIFDVSWVSADGAKSGIIVTNGSDADW